MTKKPRVGTRSDIKLQNDCEEKHKKEAGR